MDINSTTIEFSLRNYHTSHNLKNPLFLIINTFYHKNGVIIYDSSLYQNKPSSNPCEIDKAEFVNKIINSVAVRLTQAAFAFSCCCLTQAVSA